MKIKEIMTKDVISIKPDDDAKDALALLLKKEISGLPVIDDKNRLAGMFTEKEVLTMILPSYLEKVGKFMYQENPKAVKQKITNFQKMKVKDIMRREVVTVDEDTALCEVARIMLTQRVRRLPVLNKEKVVVGIVARQDVVKALFAE